MQFFNENTSNYLQFFSMTMEVLGISLAYLEIKYKSIARSIEEKILNDEEKIKEFAMKLMENKIFSALVTIFIIILFFFFVPYMFGFYDHVLPPDMKSIQQTIMWVTSPVIVLFIIGLCLILLGDFVSWLNHFSDGHAIGALGVVITGLGLLGEVYQILTIFYGG